MEKKDWHIVPECYIDTNLAEYLLDSHGVNHQKGCNAVAKKMMESNLKDQFSIGIIDNDKRQHSYVNEFTEIAHTKELSRLRSVLNCLNDKQYKCEIAELRRLFEE